ncbi:DUF1642 domain-containing protein [Enterococcus faecalis]|uniref:DUF1642 domain-containing protein n=1 Tax=Enterococcus faecalis TaxID=1351 RepID=UPI00044F58FB|nr:DUF1642 domain-containing protein [Enterococcus faecalis]ETT99990.1 hypothetical protein P003_01701 [Enterococcus faecalis EnGen0403]ETU04630.1 hypothetical protein P004_00930 [Enterococcus faecalis EnGen0404]ETU05548.1 hypothetical protein P005_00927 [Enterococcus faecalis EnGen0405]ETU16728.1 hypothetical protein P008_01071 [Enterococcus faecalis EnGen0408]
MNKQELIEEIKKDRELIKRYAENENYSAFYNGMETAYSAAIGLAKRLDESKKVVVPPMIDKFIRENEDPIYEICAWADHYGSDGRTCSDPELSTVINWFGKNSKEFYQAVINGYEVAKEQLYYVKFDILYLQKYLVKNVETDQFYLSNNEKVVGNYEQVKFTEQEIKAIDERYWPFAVKVEDE